MKKKIFSLFTSLIMVISLVGVLPAMTASATTSGDYTYKVLSDGTVEITKYSGSATTLSIPSTIAGKKVTSIGQFAALDCDSLTSVIIPNSVTSIGSLAFGDDLTSLTIGSGLVTIADDAFFACNTLTSINVDSNNKNYSSSNGILFNKNKTEIIQYPSGKNETSYSIPNSVKSIGAWAFHECYLESITIPNSVTSIGNDAFCSCSYLTSITIPNSVTSIGDEAFGYCESLTSINIPDSVISIGDFAFVWCSYLTSVTIPSGVKNIGKRAFYQCVSLKSINVDSNNNYYSSSNGVLFNKNKTTLIQYPGGNSSTFYSIPNSVTSIGDWAFANYYDSFTSITIPKSVKSIGDYAFFNRKKMNDVYYSGTKEEWNRISIGEDNDTLINATIHFNSTGPVLTSTDYKTPTEFNNKTRAKYSFLSNLLNDSDSFAVPGVITTNLGSTNCDFMTPQGICKAGDYILISAYCGANNKDPQTSPKNKTEHENHNSVLYVLNANTHSYITTIVLRDNNHVGGLAYDSNNEIVWIARSTDKSLDGISLSTIEGLLKNNNDVNVLSDASYAVKDAKIDLRASYLTYYDNKVWVGDWKTSTFAGYEVKNLSLTKATKTTSFPIGVSHTNGFAFYEYNGDTYMGISSSPGRYVASTMYTYKVNLSDLNNIKFSKKTALTMPNMSEELEIINGNAYLNFESASSAYYNPNKSSGLYPTDRICSLDAYSLFRFTINALISGQWTYRVNNLLSNTRSVKSLRSTINSNVTISSYSGNDNKIVVPSVLASDDTTYNITGIGAKTFEGNSNVTSISIPEGVTSIEPLAINNCENLSSIEVNAQNTAYSASNGKLYNKEKTELIYSPQKNSSAIPNTVEIIGEAAFFGSEISSIDIPSSVKTIDNSAFTNCNNLKEITIPKNVATIGDGAIGYVYNSETESDEKVEGFKIYCYKGTAGEEYAKANDFDYTLIEPSIGIPYTTTISEDSAYIKCNIGRNHSNWSEVGAYYGITSDCLTKAGSDNLYSSNAWAGYTLSNLSQDTTYYYKFYIIADGTTYWSDVQSFKTKKHVHTYVITVVKPTFTEKGYTLHKCSVCGNEYKDSYTDPISDSKDFEYKTLSDGTIEVTRYIGSDAEVSIPSTIQGKKVTSIGDYAFSHCFTLSSVTIENGVTSIGDGSFSCCLDLTSITIPNSVTSIGDDAFSSCTSLTSINIGNSVTQIGDDAFWGCTSLTNINIPNSVNRIGDKAIFRCPKLKTVTIPKSVEWIGNKALGYCWDASGNDIKVNNFKIKCYSNTSGEIYAKENGFSYELLDVKNPANISGFKVAATSAQAIKLTWNKVNGATGYVVYRAVNGKWQRVGIVKTNAFYEGNLKSGTSYRYAVKSYKTVNGKNYYSNSYPTIWTSTNPEIVNFTLTAASRKATVKWNKVTGATGYIVYYKTSANSKWQRLKTTTGISVTKTGLTRGRTYWFTVRAYRTVNGKNYFSAFTTKTVKVK